LEILFGQRKKGVLTHLGGSTKSITKKTLPTQQKTFEEMLVGKQKNQKTIPARSNQVAKKKRSGIPKGSSPEGRVGETRET